MNLSRFTLINIKEVGTDVGVDTGIDGDTEVGIHIHSTNFSSLTNRIAWEAYKSYLLLSTYFPFIFPFL